MRNYLGTAGLYQARTWLACLRLDSGLACRRIEFETPLFKGCAVIWAQGLPSTPKGLFDGKRRKTSITIQGRFKQELAFEDVVTGQEFGRPAQNLPAKWLVETVLIKARGYKHLSVIFVSERYGSKAG